MPLPITSLNDAAALSNVFNKVYETQNEAEYLDTTASTPGGLDIRLKVRNSKIGKALDGTAIRRANAQMTISRPVTGGSNPPQREQMSLGFTITAPEGFTALTTTDRNNVLAMLKNFLTEGNVAGMQSGLK